MIIAAVVDQNEKVVPIIEGTVLRLYDTQSKQSKDFENPALTLTEGRRGATLKFAEDHGSIAFITPPHTFCELSYEKARQDGIRFYHIEKPLLFEEVLSFIHSDQFELQKELPEEEIAPSNVSK